MYTDEVEMSMQVLYVAKQFYDHDRLDDLLAVIGENADLDPDTAWENLQESILAVFRNSRSYFHPMKYVSRYEYEGEKEVLVLKDPLLTRYDELAREYEEKRGITKVEDPFARNLESKIQRALRLNDYNYDYCWKDGQTCKKGAKLVVMLFMEFCAYYELTVALFEILDFCQEEIPKIETAIQKLPTKVIELPTTDFEKEAA